MRRSIGIGLLVLALATTALSGCGKSSGSGGGSGAGISGMDLVAGGTVMTSANYRLVVTTGQGPGGNGIQTSSSHRLQGGLVGSTQ